MAGLYISSYLCDGFDNRVVFHLLLRIDKETEDRRQKAIEEVINFMLSNIDLSTEKIHVFYRILKKPVILQ